MTPSLFRFPGIFSSFYSQKRCGLAVLISSPGFHFFLYFFPGSSSLFWGFQLRLVSLSGFSALWQGPGIYSVFCFFFYFYFVLLKTTSGLLAGMISLLKTCELLISMLLDGLSLEFERKQVSSQYYGWSQQYCCLDGLNSSSDFQLFQKSYLVLVDHSKSVNYNCYQSHTNVPQYFLVLRQGPSSCFSFRYYYYYYSLRVF